MPDETDNLDERRPPASDEEADLGEDTEAEPEAEADADDEDVVEADGDLEDAVEPRPEAVERSRPRGAKERIQDLSRARREAEQRAEAAERRAAEAEAKARREDSREAERREQEYLATLTDGEKFDYLRRKDRNEFDSRFNMLRHEQQNTSDRAEFKAMVRGDPVFAKHADEVERIHAEHWGKGTHVPRETILDLVLGRMARANRSRATGAQRRKAEGAVARETVRRGRGGGSDTPSDRGRRSSSNARDRLEKGDVKF